MKGNVKFYHIYFIGSNVGGMKKGKGSLYTTGIVRIPPRLMNSARLENQPAHRRKFGGNRYVILSSISVVLAT